jgi:hypothetical protein
MIRLLAFLLPFLAVLESLLPVLSVDSIMNLLYSSLTNRELRHISGLEGYGDFILSCPAT